MTWDVSEEKLCPRIPAAIYNFHGNRGEKICQNWVIRAGHYNLIASKETNASVKGSVAFSGKRSYKLLARAIKLGIYWWQ